MLDSIGITMDRAYEGRIDAGQLKWLAADLAALPAGTPIIVSVHIPLVTAYLAYMPEMPFPPPHHSLSVANANQVLDLFAGHNVLGVLQGHTHVNETVSGRAFLTSPAEPSAGTGGTAPISARLKVSRLSRWPTEN